jgi:hypothetical protein
MFVQVIQGRVADREGILEAFEAWRRDITPGAIGWLGTTAGVTGDGEFIALARFESADAARRNSQRPEQHRWWMETAKLFAGDVTFRDCERTDLWLGGGADDAGFVQVIQGRTDQVDRLWDLNHRFEQELTAHRPDIIGGVVAVDGTGMVTQAVYFTSEAEAREGERQAPPPELAAWMEEQRTLLGAPPRYYDLTEPWLSSPSG